MIEEKTLIAKWQAHKGKRYLELFLIRETNSSTRYYSYRGDNCGGFLGSYESDESAIKAFENNQVKCLKIDFPSVFRAQ